MLDDTTEASPTGSIILMEQDFDYHMHPLDTVEVVLKLKGRVFSKSMP